MPGVERSKRAARNDDSGSFLGTCRSAMAHSGPPGSPSIRTNGLLQAPGSDHDPSRVPPERGNGGFFPHAWRGHGGLPDDVGEPRAAPRGARPARSSACSKSGPGRIACK
jgi:hypothetical protein